MNEGLFDFNANNFQNFPDFTFEVDENGDLVVDYSVDSDPASSSYDDGEGEAGLIVEFFRSNAANPEGDTFLGRDRYTLADYNGCGTPPCEKSIVLGDAAALGVAEDDLLTATATDGNTSEFAIDPSLLPVELSSFTATMDDGAVVLAWTTASETNNAGFEVEHAAPAGGRDVQLNVRIHRL